MSAQDKTEQVLRAIHILFAQSEVYDRMTNRIIVDKQEVLGLLQQLNLCIYEMMEERDLSRQSRDAAERELRRKAEEIIQDAGHTAEDVYAGSVLYTDEALQRVEDIMQETADAMKQICHKMMADLQKEKALVHRDQSELKSHLEDLRDTNKYLKLIEERNAQIRKEKEKENAQKARIRAERRKAEKKAEQKPEQADGNAEHPAPESDGETDENILSVPAAGQPEIKINTEYFEKAGIPLPDEELPEIQEPDFSDEEAEKEDPDLVPVEIKINLDADYFKWKEENENQKTNVESPGAPDRPGATDPGSVGEKKPEKRSFFGRKKSE